MLSSGKEMPKHIAPVIGQDPLPPAEWLELLSDVLRDADVFWKAQAWTKLPSGVVEMTRLVAAYHGKGTPEDIALFLKRKDKSLTSNIDLLQAAIEKVLSEKAESPPKTKEYQFLLLKDDAKPKLKFSSKGRAKEVEQFYENLHYLLDGTPAEQHAAKRHFLELRAKVWERIRSVKLSVEEQAYFNGFERMLDAIKSHLQSGTRMPTEDVIPFFKAEETVLSRECQAKLATLKEKYTQLFKMITKEDWFNRIKVLYHYGIGDVTPAAKICNDDIRKLNGLSVKINLMIDSRDKKATKALVEKSTKISAVAPQPPASDENELRRAVESFHGKFRIS